MGGQRGPYTPWFKAFCLVPGTVLEPKESNSQFLMLELATRRRYVLQQF